MTSEPRGLLFDMVRCAGCRGCVRACKDAHGFPGDAKTTTELSATAYTAMTEVGDDHVRNLCRHCVKPSCASVCPVAALRKDEMGPVTYDASKCIGCRYCMVACPYNVPRYEWDKPVPAVRKCDMCIDRMREGRLPDCAEACRYEATVAGTRADLLKLAHARIAESPEDYYDHVYGETELGGTCVLFLAPRPTPALGFKDSLGTEPLPELTWNVLSKLPGVVTVGGAALMALFWITKRRDEVMAIERRRAGAMRQSARKEDGR
jgi:formate dehydrogenase iron-sulfur subunit